MYMYRILDIKSAERKQGNIFYTHRERVQHSAVRIAAFWADRAGEPDGRGRVKHTQSTECDDVNSVSSTTIYYTYMYSTCVWGRRFTVYNIIRHTVMHTCTLYV